VVSYHDDNSEINTHVYFSDHHLIAMIANLNEPDFIQEQMILGIIDNHLWMVSVLILAKC